MNKTLVTGASGVIGRKTLLHLLKRRPANQLIGFVRDPAKAADIAALGIELRQGDYMDPASLTRAFDGVEKVMLTATHAFTERKTAHANVVDAAVAKGVQHLVYMPITRKKGSSLKMKQVTEEDIFTEQKIIASGLNYTFASHPPFLDVLGFYIGMNALEVGVRVLAGDGKFAAATRNDLAEAHAAILTGQDNENRSYKLTGDPAVSFPDIAEILSKAHDKKVPYITITEEQFRAEKQKEGFPEHIIEFVLTWIREMNAGEWSEQTKDLEMLIGHKATTPFEFFRDDFKSPTTP